MKIIYISCIVCFYILMIMGTRPTISLFAHELGASITHIGLITSLFSLLPLMFAIFLGKKIDQLNSKVTLLIGGYLGIVGIALPGILPNFFGLYLSQLIAGSAQTIFILSAQDYVGRISTKDNRGKFVSWLSLGVALGTLIGPLLGGIIADFTNYQTTFLSLAAVGFLSCIILHFIPNESPISNNSPSDSTTDKTSSFLNLFQIPSLRVALLFSAFILFTKDLYLTFFPLLGLHLGYTDSLIGIFLAISGVASVIIRFYLATLINLFGSTKVFISSMLVCSASFITLPFSPYLFLSGIIVFFLGIGLGIGQPLSITLTIDSAINGRVAETLGLRLTVNRLTQVMTPVAFGALASVLGLASIFLIGAFMIILGLGGAHKTGAKSR